MQRRCSIIGEETKCTDKTYRKCTTEIVTLNLSLLGMNKVICKYKFVRIIYEMF